MEANRLGTRCEMEEGETRGIVLKADYRICKDDKHVKKKRTKRKRKEKNELVGKRW